MRLLPSAWVLGAAILLGGCGGDGSAGGGDSGGAGGSASTASGPGSGGGTDNATGGSGGTRPPSQKTGTFAFGLNAGYYNGQLDDVAEAKLGVAAGADSQRMKLYEAFLDQWGDDVRLPQTKQYLAMGMKDLVCFIIGANADHTNAPSGQDPEHYSPKNLYEPIFTDAGDVNPDNYWAKFVERLVKTYGPYVHSWEVWNEPDQVGGNWQATQSWTTQPPKPSDLIWWNDSIFAYIRLLRVTHAVVHKMDPKGEVTLGGIGYSGFLDAILRYTDEPTGGAVDADHPEKGGAYFDVVSYHYYPVFSPGSSDVGAKGIIDSLHDFQKTLAKYDVTDKTFIVTESGAPRFALGTYPGGVDYAHNYLMKSMSLAHDAGVRRIDWFILGDGADVGASQDSFQYMGLYLNLTPVTDPANAKLTESGIAYATLGHLLKDSLSDPDATKAIHFAAKTSGVALTTADGKRAYVVWAEASDEKGSGTVKLPLGGDGMVYAWDYSKTQATSSVSASGGNVSVKVTSAPVIVIGPK